MFLVLLLLNIQERYNYRMFLVTTKSSIVTGTITVVASSTTSTNSNIYFENGTCKCPNANVGDHQ